MDERAQAAIPKWKKQMTKMTKMNRGEDKEISSPESMAIESCTQLKTADMGSVVIFFF
jgi:hypothetical protein